MPLPTATTTRDAADRGRVGRLGVIGVVLLWLAPVILAAVWAYRALAHLQSPGSSGR
jgi:hypothetical protein